MAAKKRTGPQAAQATATPPAPPASGSQADSRVRLDDMPVEVVVEIGRQRLSLDQALALGEQSVLELEQGVGEPVAIKLNGKLFARGEVVTVAECFGVRITEIVESGAEA